MLLRENVDLMGRKKEELHISNQKNRIRSEEWPKQFKKSKPSKHDKNQQIWGFHPQWHLRIYIYIPLRLAYPEIPTNKNPPTGGNRRSQPAILPYNDIVTSPCRTPTSTNWGHHHRYHHLRDFTRGCFSGNKIMLGSTLEMQHKYIETNSYKTGTTSNYGFACAILNFMKRGFH